MNPEITVTHRRRVSPGFVTFTAMRQEHVKPKYGREIDRQIDGPIYIQDPNSSDRSAAVVSLFDGWLRDRELIVARGASLNWARSEPARCFLDLKHSFACDEEADRSSLMRLELASLQFDSVYNNTTNVEAWITKAYIYEMGDSGTGRYDDSPDILTAVKQPDGEDGYGNSGYPYLPPEKESLLGVQLPVRVQIVLYGKTDKGWFEKRAGK